jgi:hypothetical protein
MCLTPIEARVLTKFSGLSFTNGIMGSTRMDTGMPFSIRISAAYMRFDDGGA